MGPWDPPKGVPGALWPLGPLEKLLIRCEILLDVGLYRHYKLTANP